MSVAMSPYSRNPSADHRILICEDDRLIAMGWAAMLADGGYTVVGPAHSAEKALKMAYQHLPTLALVDIDLGGTIDGISVAAELAPLGVAAGQSGEARIFLIQDDNLTAEVPLRRSILQSTLRQKYRSTGRHNPQRDGGPEK